MKHITLAVQLGIPPQIQHALHSAMVKVKRETVSKDAHLSSSSADAALLCIQALQNVQKVLRETIWRDTCL